MLGIDFARGHDVNSMVNVAIGEDGCAYLIEDKVGVQVIGLTLYEVSLIREPIHPDWIVEECVPDCHDSGVHVDLGAGG